jgi:hypothetical protein
LLLDDAAVSIYRSLIDELEVFLLISFHHGSTHITRGMMNKPVCGRSAETYPHFTGIITIIIIHKEKSREVTIGSG